MSKEQSKIAVLVLAANAPQMLGLLAAFFHQNDQFHVFVHLDAKSDLSLFEQNVNEFGGSVTFSNERTKVFWRGFSMIEATFILIRQALCDATEYDCFVLISDDTLPLLSVHRLAEELVKVPRRIQTRRPHEPELLQRYSGYYMLDSEATQVRWIPILERQVASETVDKMNRLEALRKKGKKPLPALCHGSQWWSLSRSDIEILNASWIEDDWLRESFEFSEVPDEGYIHTILGNSQNPPVWHDFMFVDWSTAAPPRVFKSAKELQEIQTGECIFVRKVALQMNDVRDFLSKGAIKP